MGFYPTKAKNLHNISRIILQKFNGKVPDDLDELLKLPGVGRKTAEVIVTALDGIPEGASGQERPGHSDRGYSSRASQPGDPWAWMALRATSCRKRQPVALRP